jgi:hypothetical protein
MRRQATGSSGPGRSAQAQQWTNTGLYILDDAVRHLSGELDAPGVPIDTLDLIGQYGAGDRQTVRQDDFERVSLDRTGDWTDNEEGSPLMLLGDSTSAGRHQSPPAAEDHATGGVGKMVNSCTSTPGG